jgi:PAS domain S-box-containing protein
MENSGEERRVDHAADASPLRLLDLLITRLAEPAAVLDESLRLVAVNDAFRTVAATDIDPVGEPLTTAVPTLTVDAVEGSIEGTDEYVTARTGEAPDRWTEFRVDRYGPHRLCIGRDVTAREAQRQRLVEHERVLDAIHDAVYTLDEDATIRSVNGAVESLTGYDAEELVGANASLLLDEATVERGRALTRELRAGTREVATMTAELTTADGETVPVETQFSTWPRERGPDRHVGVLRDVADRQAFVETLAAVQQATQELLAAETTEAVAEHIVETATDVLGLSGATLYLFDVRRNVLWPAGSAGAAGRDERTAISGGAESVVREVFLEGAATTVEGGDRYQPLGDHGVFHTVTGDPGSSDRDGATPGDERRGELVELLAESARAALERLDREAMLRERDANHRQQAERVTELERELSVVRRVHRVLADADMVADVEREVCAALTASSWLSFAWVGRTDGERVEPRAWAGHGSEYLEAVALAVDDPDAPPAVQTAASNQVTAVGRVAEAIRERHWRRAAIARDFQAVISVPLRADGVGYGVLTVYANQPVEWGDSLTPVFTELATSVAVAVRDRERRTRLAADSGVELDLTVSAPEDPLERLAAALGETVCCAEAIPVDGPTTRLFLSIPGVDSDAVAEAVDGIHSVDPPVPVTDGNRYELHVQEPTVVGQVVRHGGRLETACVSDGELTLTVTLAADTDVRTFADRLGSSCDHVQLTARRHQPGESRRRGGIRESLESALTDRQLEALRTAYGSGFFEWPRETTGEGVAEMLGVAQPTVNRHLRVSQRKLLELVFDDE